MIEGVGLKTNPPSTGNGIPARDRSIDRRPRASPGVTLARARPWRPSRSPPFSVTFAPSRRRRPPSGACVCASRASRSRAVGRRRGRRAIDDDANDRERVARSIGRDLDDARRARGASEGTSEGWFEMREVLFIRDSLPSRPRARASSTRRRRRGRGIGSSPRARTFAGDEERLAARAPRNERATTDDARATNERQIHQARRRSRGFERIRRKGVQGRALPRRRRRRARAGAWRAFARERYDRDTMMGGLKRVRGDDATRVRERRRDDAMDENTSRRRRDASRRRRRRRRRSPRRRRRPSTAGAFVHRISILSIFFLKK